MLNATTIINYANERVIRRRQVQNATTIINDANGDGNQEGVDADVMTDIHL